MAANNMQNTAIGFVVGLGIGAALGILMAPKSGDETRDFLIGGAKDAINSVAASGQKLTQDARRAVGETAERVADRVRNAAEEGERAYNKANGA